MPITKRPTPRNFTKVVSRSSAGNPDYICDGIDDDVQIQAAIDAVAAGGGGTVFIREGTYILGTGITVANSGISIIGEGIGATIIKAKAAFPTNTSIVSVTNAAPVGCLFSSFTIDGNKDNQTTENHHGLSIQYGTDHTIINVEAKNCNRNSGNYGGFFCQSDYYKMIGCISHDNDLLGFFVESGGDAGSFTNCVAYNNGGIGFSITGTKTKLCGCVSYDNVGSGYSLAGSEIVASACTSYSNDSTGFSVSQVFITINGCSISNNTLEGVTSIANGTKVLNSTIRNNGRDGVKINTPDNNIISNNTISSGALLDADNTYSGILITGTSTRNVIVGNRITKETGTNDFIYGIREAAAADDRNLIVGNIVTDAQTANISTQGANTVAANNIEA